MNKFLKIAIVCYPSIGGSGIIATELGLKLAKIGHQVHFISYEKPFRLTNNKGVQKNIFFHKVPINEYSLFKFPDYSLPLSTTITEVHHKYNLDIVHAHYAVPHATAALLAKQICSHCLHTYPKVITTLHGTDISLMANDRSLSPVVKYSVEKSDAVSSVSNWLAKETHKTLKTKKEITTIYNFFDPKPPTKTKLQSRFELGLRPNDLVAIHLSNLRPVKRIQDLLTIAKQVKYRKFKLLILAGGDFSPYQKQVDKLKLGSKVIVRQNVSDIENYITASDIGLFTSESESFGLSILECMSYGLPIVATRTGGVPEVVDKKTGYLEKIGDTKSMANRIDEVATNRDLLKKLSEGALKKSKVFSSEIVVSQYEQLYYLALREVTTSLSRT